MGRELFEGRKNRGTRDVGENSIFEVHPVHGEMSDGTMSAKEVDQVVKSSAVFFDEEVGGYSALQKYCTGQISTTTQRFLKI